MLKFSQIKLQLFFRLFILYLFVSFLCRLCYLFYFPGEADITSMEIIKAFVIGLRFDTATFFLFNILPLILLMLPLRNVGFYQWLSRLLILPLLLFIFLMIADFFYYPAVRHKLGNEVLITLKNFGAVFAMSLKDYWYGWLAILLCSWGFAWLVLRYLLKPFNKDLREWPNFEKGITRKKILALEITFFIAFILVAIIGIRGGVQMRPLQTIHAYQNEKTFLGDLALPGAYTAVSAIYLDEELPLYDPDFRQKSAELRQLLNNGREDFPDDQFVFFRHQRADTRRRQLPLNVYLIIIESLSANAMQSFGHTAQLTPFLDQLGSQSLFFDRAYAAGQRSIVSLPAILSSLPSTDRQVFLMSAQQNNRHISLATALKRKGYHTIFAHGAQGGSMGFAAYARSQGFARIIEAESIGISKENSDGLWGVFDEFTVAATDRAIVEHRESSSQPFLSVFYSLNPHSPYEIPEFRKKEARYQIAPGALKDRRGQEMGKDFARSLRYLDSCVEEIIKLSRQNGYYENTLFIITSDHTHSQQVLPDIFHIPLFFHAPLHLKPKKDSRIASQLDILPTILDMLNLEAAHSSAGKSLIRGNTRYDFALFDFWHEMGFFYDKYLALFKDGKLSSLFDFQRDVSLQKNLISAEPRQAQQLSSLWLAFHSALNNSKKNNQIAK